MQSSSIINIKNQDNPDIQNSHAVFFTEIHNIDETKSDMVGACFIVSALCDGFLGLTK